MTTEFRLCSCNRSMPLTASSGARIGTALGVGSLPVAHQMCISGTPLSDASDNGDVVVVGCTQERALFEQMAAQQARPMPLRFVNLRESAGWGTEAGDAIPKMAALLADAARPAPAAVPSVQYRSAGRTLIIGAATDALMWAAHLAPQLDVTVLLVGNDAGSGLPTQREFPIFSGSQVRISGWLGAFHATWHQENPIDLDRCVRCNACIAACPEDAISASYQIDSDKCRLHGDCVDACGAVQAIDFRRVDTVRNGEFDLILDLLAAPTLSMHQLPKGYLAPGTDLRRQIDAAGHLTTLTGDFEKPRYFQYRERLCAHARNQIVGCSACIDICSAQAIMAAGDKVTVNPNLCAGCGACTTVCPSGALTYAYPDVPDLGGRLKRLLATYRAAGGSRPVVLFHDRDAGAELLHRLGQRARRGGAIRGMPARILPLDLHHAASAGLEVWLGAIAFGAFVVRVLLTGDQAPQYTTALRQQVGFANAILHGLGFPHAAIDIIEATSVEALDVRLHALPVNGMTLAPAKFDLMPDKRGSLDFIIDHLSSHAPRQPDQIDLPAGAPFGALAVDTTACTLCMACTGACPTSALMTTADRPQLRFIEKNCIQCGLCVATCPEQALALMPRLLLTPAAKQPRVLHEDQPFLCIGCNAPLGSAKIIANLLTRLGGHAAFAGNPERLKMCGDCRVVDMMRAQHAVAPVSMGKTP